MKVHFFNKIMPLLLLFGCSITDSWAQEKSQNNPIPLQTEPPKTFTIDETTGEVQGCELIKLVGENNLNDLEQKINKSLDIELISRKVKSKYGLKGEYAYSILSNDNKYFTYIEYIHGGYLSTVYFFTIKGILLNKYNFQQHTATFEKPSYNNENTFFKVSDNKGNFYFFTSKGKLFRKGNLNELTNYDKGNSIGGHIDISKNGELILVSGYSTYILTKGNDIVPISSNACSSSFIDTNKNLLYLCSSHEIKIVNSKSLKTQYDFINLKSTSKIIGKQIILTNYEKKYYIYEIL